MTNYFRKPKNRLILGTALLFLGLLPETIGESVLPNFLSNLVGLIIFASLITGIVLILLAMSEAVMSRRLLKLTTISIWSAVILGIALTVYVNYSLPHGQRYPTGEIVCENDDRGPCHEQYREDLRGVDIPEWAKFIRQNPLWYMLGVSATIAGIIATSRQSHE